MQALVPRRPALSSVNGNGHGRIDVTSLLGTLAGALLVTGCAGEPDVRAANTIYFGGPILTMEGDAPSYAEALVVKEGRSSSSAAWRRPTGARVRSSRSIWAARSCCRA